ncbi:MAG: SprT family zinc-dependent metalloprotease [Candidatus Levybacteria bacterium]|nr:SprT family zinc-dependent metalloprotease [Candidatus Levybacteria bacterium]
MEEIESLKITRSDRRSIAIVVLPNGTVEVRAPKYIPEFAIKAFVKSKSEWIKVRQEYVKKNTKPSKKFENGEKFVFLGHEYSLLLGPYIHIEIKEDQLLFPLALAARGRETMEKWYIKQAKTEITKLADEYTAKMETAYNGISFSDTKSKWGSCTHDDRLQFNWRLIMTPLLVVRYVVIHELAHTIEKNHSAKFWNKVRSVNPSYKQQIKWLKENGHGLTV